MFVRKSCVADIPAIAALYESAKSLLKSNGINQWQTGYPNPDSAAADVSAGNSYVIEADGIVIGTAYIAFGEEPTYRAIYDGTWPSDISFYGFVHRVAVSPAFAGKGLAALLFEKAAQLAAEQHISTLRCDTHEENFAMQKTLLRNGYQKCGIILLENGDRRIGYEKTLS